MRFSPIEIRQMIDMARGCARVHRIDPLEAFEEIFLGIERGSFLALDNVGLSVKGSDLLSVARPICDENRIVGVETLPEEEIKSRFLAAAIVVAKNAGISVREAE